MLSSNPELIPWAYVHASTLHNCFAVTAGTTPYERAFQVKYNGRLAMWGETVLFAISDPIVVKAGRSLPRVCSWGKPC